MWIVGPLLGGAAQCFCATLFLKVQISEREKRKLLVFWLLFFCNNAGMWTIAKSDQTEYCLYFEIKKKKEKSPSGSSMTTVCARPPHTQLCLVNRVNPHRAGSTLSPRRRGFTTIESASSLEPLTPLRSDVLLPARRRLVNGICGLLRG